MRPVVLVLPLLVAALAVGCGQQIVVGDQTNDDELPVNTGLPPGQNPNGPNDPSDPNDPNDPPPNDPNDPGDPGNTPSDPADPPEIPPEDVIPPNAQQCQVWQDCGPHFGDLNSGLECVNNECACDPNNEWAGTCSGNGGFWVAQECLCTFADEAPPASAPSENCWWHWYDEPNSTGCEPDRWVDTSRYEDQCYYDSFQDRTVCDAVWVESGYWESGDCGQGYWIEYCR